VIISAVSADRFDALVDVGEIVDTVVDDVEGACFVDKVVVESGTKVLLVVDADTVDVLAETEV